MREKSKSVLQSSRESIDGMEAARREKLNLLAMTQIMVSLRFDDPKLLEIFGGRQTLIESPLIQEIVGERVQRTLLRVLSSRFGPVPADIETPLESIFDEVRLNELADCVGTVGSLDEFRTHLTAKPKRKRKK